MSTTPLSLHEFLEEYEKVEAKRIDEMEIESSIEQGEDRVRNILRMNPQDILSEEKEVMAGQFSRVIRGESVTPEPRMQTAGKILVDTSGRHVTCLVPKEGYIHPGDYPPKRR